MAVKASSLLGGGNTSGYPFLFPSLFGGGGDGSLTLTTTADVGYLGSYGAKQATSASLAAGQTLTVAQGGGNGALIFACSGTLTIAGTITANGANGSNGLVDGGGAGGAMAGGGTGGAKQTANGNAQGGTPSAKTGHGGRDFTGSTLASFTGGTSGAFQDNNAASGNGGTVLLPIYDTTATYAIRYELRRLIKPTNYIRYYPWGISQVSGTQSTSGTVTPAYPATANYGPWSQVAGEDGLSLDFLFGGFRGAGGAVTGVAGQQAAGGGGGGGGGVIYIEANNLILTAGYSITANGGTGGNGFSSNGTTAVAGGGCGGMGGLVIIVYRTLTGSTAAITATGGTGGTGAGTSAVNGLNGANGGVFLIKV